MDLNFFLNARYRGRKLTYGSEMFIRNVYYPYLKEYGLNLINPETPFERDSGKNNFIDFTIKTKLKKYAIEIDDYGTHGVLSPEQLIDQNDRQNVLSRKGYTIHRVPLDDIKQKPHKCIDQLKRLFIADEELNVYALNKYTDKKITPYEPQRIALDKIEKSRAKGNKKGIIIHATGLGKTYLTAFDAKRYNKKTLFIVHLNDVLEQNKNAFDDVWPQSSKGFYYGKEKTKGIFDKQVIFASVQTLSKTKNLEIFDKNHFDYIIFDETHHVTAKSYQKILNYFKPSFLLGVTGTPVRTDGTNVQTVYDDNVIDDVGVHEAMDKGWLVSFKYITLDDDIDYSKIYHNGFRYDEDDLNKLLIVEKRDKAIVKEYKYHALGKKTIGFCPSIEYAEHISNVFNKNGFKTKAIHSDVSQLSAEDRAEFTEGFRNNDYEIIFCKDVFNEGIDFPDVECLLFLRPTESEVIFTQQLGRGLRISPRKESVIVLDFIGENQYRADQLRKSLGIEDKEIKDTYYFDNNNCEVHFTKRLQEFFNRSDALLSQRVRIEKISDEWIQYAKAIEVKTKNQAFCKIQKQNKNILDQLLGCKILYEKPDIKDGEFKIEIKKYTEEFTAGRRGLFLSKILGLLKEEKHNKWVVTKVFEKIYLRDSSLTNKRVINNIITDQIEKLFYFGGIGRDTDIRKAKDTRVFFTDFKNYFIMTLYKIILEIGKTTGSYTVSLEEWRFFIIFLKNYNDWDSAYRLIINFREEENIHDLRRLLKEKTPSASQGLDDRIPEIFKYSNHLKINNTYIKIPDEKIDIVNNRINKFENLLKTKSIILFDKHNKSKYLNYLQSNDLHWR